MEASRLCTPTRPSQSRILTDGVETASHLDSRQNTCSPALSERSRTASLATNRLIGFNRGVPTKRIRKRSLPSATITRAHHDHRPQGAREWLRSKVVSSEGGPDSSGIVSFTTADRTDLGDPGKPIVHFRPQLWKHIERTRATLNLDLFWPQRYDDTVEVDEGNHDDGYSDKDTFPLRGLLPLCEFRNLRSLRLGGLMQSYQTQIWRACWVNPDLGELILEMALDPVMNESGASWAPIDGTWSRKNDIEAFTGYL
jgi:hypothetical protein